jgi:riboflavin kinase/FMN adenylyltransferase
MKVHDCLDDFVYSGDGCVVTIGNFDGVHLGHQAIIEYGRRLADAENLSLVGVTFEPSPARFLRPDSPARVLTPIALKKELLSEVGLDELIVIEPTRDFLSLSDEDFVEQVLVKRIGVRHIVEGQTFGFGRRRGGTVVGLKKLAEQFGFKSHIVNAVTRPIEGESLVAISSSLIRPLAGTGQFDKVHKCLGRDYILSGKIVSGRGWGRKIGFPTVNIELENAGQIVPEDGVFAGWASWGAGVHDARCAKVYDAAISIGHCETFSDGKWQIEAFLLDYGVSENYNRPDDKGQEPEPLAGKSMLLGFAERIREQRRFGSVEELAEAIKADCQQVRKAKNVTAHGINFSTG